MDDTEEAMRSTFERIMKRKPRAMIIMADYGEFFGTGAAGNPIDLRVLIEAAPEALLAMLQNAEEAVPEKRALNG